MTRQFDNNTVSVKCFSGEILSVGIPFSVNDCKEMSAERIAVLKVRIVDLLRSMGWDFGIFSFCSLYINEQHMGALVQGGFGA